MKLAKKLKQASVGVLCAALLIPTICTVNAQQSVEMVEINAIKEYSDEEWAAVTSPEIEYVTDGSKGSEIFDECVPDLEAYVHAICMDVAKMIYTSPEEVPVFEKLTFKIIESDMLAWKAGDPPHIEVGMSSAYIENFANAGNDLAEEVRGVLYHELTHAYQHSGDSTIGKMELSAIEGVADLVRYMGGYIPLYQRRPGGNYDSSYKTTAFFFDWVRATYADEFDFLYELNQSANPDRGTAWTWDEAFMEITGRPVAELWEEYQAELKEKGMDCPTSIERKEEAMKEEAGNLLKGKAVVVSHEQHEGEGGAMAVDGQVAGVNGGNTKWCTTKEGDKWLQVDLGEERTIDRWVVKHAGAGGENAIWNTKDFKLQKSTNGKEWKDVDVVTDNTLNVTDRKVEPFQARYLRLYITTPTNDENPAARIYEFEAYAPNLVLNRPVQVSHEQHEGEGGAMAVDGQVAGENGGNTKWCTTKEGDKWLQVELDKMQTINRWVVKHAGAGGENAVWNTKDFRLEVSRNGKDWKTVDQVEGNTLNVTDRTIKPVKAKYVRLYITTPTNDENPAARIYEFGVY